MATPDDLRITIDTVLEKDLETVAGYTVTVGSSYVGQSGLATEEAFVFKKLNDALLAIQRTKNRNTAVFK